MEKPGLKFGENRLNDSNVIRILVKLKKKFKMVLAAILDFEI